MTNKQYTFDELIELVNADFNSDMTVDEIIKKYNISYSVFYEVIGFTDEEEFK